MIILIQMEVYNFLIAQQDATKKFIPKRISHRQGFEKNIGQLLPAFTVDEIEKYGLNTNKNSK